MINEILHKVKNNYGNVEPKELKYYAVHRFASDDLFQNEQALSFVKKGISNDILSSTFESYLISNKGGKYITFNMFDHDIPYLLFENIEQAYNDYLGSLIKQDEQFALPSRFLRKTVTEYFPNYVDKDVFKAVLEQSGLYINLGR